MKESTKYPKKLVESAVKSSISIAEVMRKLEIKWSGGQQNNIKKWIVAYKLNTSHFLGQASNRGKKWLGGTPKLHFSDVLIKNNKDRREPAFRLRRALIESGRSYQCEVCNNAGEWMGKPMMLQVEHSNGDWNDNRSENLKFLCPNCHTQTEGWSGRKGGAGITAPNRKYYKRKNVPKRKETSSGKLCPCGKAIKRRSTTCYDCMHKNQRRAERPSFEVLKQELETSNYSAVGRKYGVSDNSIRKWMKQYRSQ